MRWSILGWCSEVKKSRDFVCDRNCMEHVLKINPHIAKLKCGDKNEFACLARTFQRFHGYQNLKVNYNMEANLI